MAQPSATRVAATTARPATDWDTALYLKFEAERAQPAHDLIARDGPVQIQIARVQQALQLDVAHGREQRLLQVRMLIFELREHAADRVEGFRVGARVGARGPPDGLLVDGDDLVEGG